MTNNMIQSVSSYTPYALTLQYNEHDQSFHVLKGGKKISTLIPEDKISMKTFKGLLEVLSRGEDE